tara:strand:- start:498 stop:680 length:183 start_codon:yes stop_codon:yes gene_type:complete
VISLNKSMPVEYIQLTRLQKLEIMENQELTTMRRQSRKKKHMAKRKGRFDHRTGRPGKSK